MLCCVMLLIVGETKQLNEETPIRGPEIRRRGERSVHTDGELEILTMLLRDLLRLRLQTFYLNLNKHNKQAFELLTTQKATVIGIKTKNIPDVLVSSVMLTFLYLKTSTYVAPNRGLI